MCQPTIHIHTPIGALITYNTGFELDMALFKRYYNSVFRCALCVGEVVQTSVQNDPYPKFTYLLYT